MAELHVVDAATGELQEPGCDGCESLAVQVAGLERDIRAWRTRCANLERDSEREAREHEDWPAIRELFDVWRRECKYPRARFSAERFHVAQPIFAKEGTGQCQRAIRGAAYDPYTTKRRNGTEKRHNGWDLIFRDRSKFEDFKERAPEPIDPNELSRLTSVILAAMPEDDRHIEDRIYEATNAALPRLKERQ